MQLKIHLVITIHLVTFTTNRCLNRSLTPPNRTKFRIPIQAIEEERRSDRLKGRKDQHTHTHTHINTYKSSRVNQEQTASRPMALEQRRR